MHDPMLLERLKRLELELMSLERSAEAALEITASSAEQYRQEGAAYAFHTAWRLLRAALEGRDTRD